MDEQSYQPADIVTLPPTETCILNTIITKVYPVKLVSVAVLTATNSLNRSVSTGVLCSALRKLIAKASLYLIKASSSLFICTEVSMTSVACLNSLTTAWSRCRKYIVKRG